MPIMTFFDDFHIFQVFEKQRVLNYILYILTAIDLRAGAAPA